MVLFILVFLFFVSFLGAQFWTLDFESAGGYTTSIVEFTDGSEDFWIRTDGSDHSSSVVYNGVIGSYYFAGMDIDSEGATLPVFIDIDDINISGQTNLEFRIYLAEDEANDAVEDWDEPDYVHIYYDIDNSGSFSNLIWIENDGSTYNSAPYIDTDFDGIGDGTEITDSFVQFTVSIPGTGSLLDIQIEFNLDSGDEDIAIDHLQLAVAAGVPDPTSFAATTFSTDRIDVSWLQNVNSDDVMLAWSADGVFGTPVNGTGYSAGNSIAGGGTVLYNGSNLIYYHTPLSPETQYYYKAWSVDGSNDYSTGVTDDATTFKGEPSNHVTGFTASTDWFSVIDLAWTDAIGSILPDGYLIKGNDVSAGSITAPVDGTPESDGDLILNVVQGIESASFSYLDPETTYYFNIYPYTNSGTAIDYKTDGTIPTDNVTTGIQPPIPAVFISEYLEGSSNNKALEIFNGTGASIDLSEYVLEKCNNGAVWGTGNLFTFEPGAWIVADGDVWVNVNADETLGMSAVADSIGGGLTWFNGDDSIGLFKIVGTNTMLIDVIGENGVDPGSYWPVAGVSNGTQNHTLVRKSTVTTGNTDWASSAGTDADDSEWIVNDEDTWSDLGSHTFGGNVTPFITNIVRNPAGDILTTTTVSVSATVTDSDGTIGLVELHWGLASGSLTNTISMSSVIADIYTTDSDIPAQLDLTTVYYEIYAEDNVPESSTSTEQSYRVFDAQSTTLPYTEPFDADLGICYTYSDSGATKFWVWDSYDINGFAYMSGYNSGETEEDWLILPAIDFDSYANETMTFDTWYNYGTDNATNYLKLYYSSDYPGLGDPSGHTWSELAFTHPGASQSWTSSGSIDLSAISGTSVYIAFKYRYEVSMYRNWEVDNISITAAGTLDPPINIIITHNGTDAIIVWDAVTGATSYKIYSDNDPYGSFSTLEVEIPGTTWTDFSTTGEKKFYHVIAVN